MTIFPTTAWIGLNRKSSGMRVGALLLAVAALVSCDLNGPTVPSCGSNPVPVSGDITPPVKVSGPNPQYTEEARRERIQGVVVVEATINCVGEVTAVRVLQGLPLGLTEAAVESVRRWRFQPATLDGRPIAVLYNLSVHFRLQ